jgi:hypothetical protein
MLNSPFNDIKLILYLPKSVSNLRLRILITFTIFLMIIGSVATSSYFNSGPLLIDTYGDKGNVKNKKEEAPFVGVNVRGYNTSIQYTRYSIPFPNNYYNDSFNLISKAGMNHIRYALYWEAYERDSRGFIQELKTVARMADKYGLKVIYDNHQFHTSSWLDPKNGTGFPANLFWNDTGTEYNAGGSTADRAAEVWWTRWWNKTITDPEGNDGWKLQAKFLKRIAKTLDNYKSTLGYELLNEPQIHSSDQWNKVGKYNTFMTKHLRKVTDKTIVYSMNVPISFKNPSIDLTPENVAKMSPSDKKNVVFKISVYGLPLPDTYQGDKVKILTEAGKMAGVPMYIGEWNEVSREEKINENGNLMFQINPNKSRLNQEKVDLLIQDFKRLRVWGTAFWNWNYVLHPAPNFNLIKVNNDGNIHTTVYYKILKNTINKAY